MITLPKSLFAITALASLLILAIGCDRKTEWDASAVPTAQGFGVTFETRVLFYPRVAFATPELGWFLGDDGRVWKTLDSGRSLKEVELGEAKMRDLCIFANGEGWLVGDNSTILHTTDGIHWRQQSRLVTSRTVPLSTQPTAVTSQPSAFEPDRLERLTSGDYSFRHVSFADKLHGWVLGEPSRGLPVVTPNSLGGHTSMARTDDGGQIWDVIRPGVEGGGRLSQIRFVSSKIGWGISERSFPSGWSTAYYSELVATDDGGETWRAVAVADDTPANPIGIDPQDRFEKSVRRSLRLRSLDIVNNGFGVAAGEVGALVVSRDGGKTWHYHTLGTSAFQASFVHDTSSGWVQSESGDLYQTLDGGQNWKQLLGSATRYVDGRLFLRNRPPAILFDSVPPPPLELWQLRPQLLTQVAFPDMQTGWVLGPRCLLHTKNAGITWEPVPVIGNLSTPYEANLGSLVALDAMHAWVGNDRGTIIRTTDGSAWKAVANLSNVSSPQLAFTSPERGWAITPPMGLSATNDGGAHWSPVSLQSSSPRPFAPPSFRAIAASSDSTVVAVGEAGAVYQTIDGVTWQPRHDIPPVSLRSVAVKNQRAWTVGDRCILSLQDGVGAELQGASDTPTPELESVTFRSGTHGFAVGHAGSLLVTTDGGELWRRVTVPRTGDLFTSVAAAPGSDQVWVVGSGGLLSSRRTHGAPRVVRVEAVPGDATLVATVATEAAQAKIIRVDFSRDPSAGWTHIRQEDLNIIEISANDLIRKREPNMSVTSFRISWTPDNTRYGVREGTPLHYRIKTLDADGLSGLDDVPAEFVYRPFWSRQPVTVKAAVYAFVAFALYGMLIAALAWRFPYSLYWLASRLPALSAGDTPVAKALTALAPVLLLGVAKGPRVRRAWARRYAAGKARLDELKSPLRDEYLRDLYVLDGWVSRHLLAGTTAFENEPPVVERKEYVSLPVRISTLGLSSQPCTPEEAVHEVGSHLSAQGRVVIAITGLGGSGKSTLAFRLAAHGASRDPQFRLAPYPIFPVLVTMAITNPEGAIEQAIRRAVPADDVHPDLVRRLAENKRLLVLVDGLSELGSDAGQAVEELNGRLSVGLLVVTSRRQVVIRGVAPVVIETTTLKGAGILTFFLDFIKKLEVRPRADLAPFKLDTDGVLDLQRQLVAFTQRLSNRQSITPLLVRLFAEACLTPGNTTAPFSLIDAVVGYLRSVNPNTDGVTDRLEPSSMVEVAKTLARLCLRPDGIPKRVSVADCEVALGGAAATPSPRSAIRRLRDNGVLSEITYGGTEFIGFSLDPLAEYLAALKCIEDIEGSGVARVEWRIQLAKSWDRTLSPGFVAAIEEVVHARGIVAPALIDPANRASDSVPFT